MSADATVKEGNLKAPERHPLGQDQETFWDEEALYAEMERQFDICHTCRRCFPLCDSFPTLFDLIDESPTLELDGVPREAYWKVVDQCYLCDLCFMTKCPYTPPHEFNMDFPHLMLRAKAVRTRNHGAKLRDRVLTSTDAVGKLAGIPVAVLGATGSVGQRFVRVDRDRVHHHAGFDLLHLGHLAGAGIRQRWGTRSPRSSPGTTRARSATAR